MTPLMLHAFLESRAIMSLYLKPETFIHPGAGQDGIVSITTRFTVDGTRTPIIPAESLKGALRSLASILAKHIDFGDPLVNEIVKTLHSKDRHLPKDVDKRNKVIEKYKDQAKDLLSSIYLEDQLAEMGSSRIVELFLSVSCPICRLFGAPGLAGKLLISDAIPVDANTEEVITPGIRYYTSTSIDRQTRTVSEEKLFVVESIVPTEALRFKAEIIADNIDNQEDLILQKLLSYLKLRGLQLGGHKSRGYGLLKLDENKTKIVKVSFKIPPKSLQEKLDNIKALLRSEGI